MREQPLSSAKAPDAVVPSEHLLKAKDPVAQPVRTNVQIASPQSRVNDTPMPSTPLTPAPLQIPVPTAAPALKHGNPVPPPATPSTSRLHPVPTPSYPQPAPEIIIQQIVTPQPAVVSALPETPQPAPAVPQIGPGDVGQAASQVEPKRPSTTIGAAENIHNSPTTVTTPRIDVALWMRRAANVPQSGPAPLLASRKNDSAPPARIPTPMQPTQLVPASAEQQNLSASAPAEVTPSSVLIEQMAAVSAPVARVKQVQDHQPVSSLAQPVTVSPEIPARATGILQNPGRVELPPLESSTPATEPTLSEPTLSKPTLSKPALPQPIVDLSVPPPMKEISTLLPTQENPVLAQQPKPLQAAPRPVMTELPSTTQASLAPASPTQPPADQATPAELSPLRPSPIQPLPLHSPQHSLNRALPTEVHPTQPSSSQPTPAQLTPAQPTLAEPTPAQLPAPPPPPPHGAIPTETVPAEPPQTIPHAPAIRNITAPVAAPQRTAGRTTQKDHTPAPEPPQPPSPVEPTPPAPTLTPVTVPEPMPSGAEVIPPAPLDDTKLAPVVNPPHFNPQVSHTAQPHELLDANGSQPKLSQKPARPESRPSSSNRHNTSHDLQEPVPVIPVSAEPVVIPTKTKAQPVESSSESLPVPDAIAASASDPTAQAPMEKAVDLRLTPIEKPAENAGPGITIAAKPLETVAPHNIAEPKPHIPGPPAEVIPAPDPPPVIAQAPAVQDSRPYREIRQDRPTQLAAPPELVLPEKPLNTQPMKSLSLDFTPDGTRDVRLHISQSNGDVRVSLHSSDPGLTGKLREGVQDLTGGLADAGYQAEAWSHHDDGRRKQQPDEVITRQTPRSDDTQGFSEILGTQV